MSKRLFYKRYFLPVIAFLFLASGCDHNNTYHSAEGVIWHTFWRATFKGPEVLADSILPVLNNVGSSLSVFDSLSVVSKVNQSLQCEVDRDFIRVYNESRRINRLTDGAFDPTLSPLITAWGFGKGHTATTDTCRIDSILGFVGIGKSHLEGNRIVKNDRRTEFNFSAIAKGYGCDMIAEMFRRNGVTDFLIEIGGEIVASGKSPRGGKWNVGVEKPSADASAPQEAQEVVELSSGGMATSGNYRNFHLGSGGKRFGHTLSPATGRPVSTDVASATVIAPSCMEADALATSMMVLGSEKAIRLADTLGYPVMLILTDGSILRSDKWENHADK